MDTVTAGRRLDWAIIGTSLSLLALQGLVGAAHAQMPSVVYPSNGGGRSEVASLQRSRNGTYSFNTSVNGTPVQMMFDTGASAVALRAEDAEKIGINLSGLSYSLTFATANGQAQAAPVMLETLTVGGITRHRVPAVVGRPGALSGSLLGQTFLSRLAGFRREGETIVLQGE